MENCCVCFNNDPNLVRINEFMAKTSISIKSQLETLVPEVTWLDYYAICLKCQDSLNLIQEFRRQCLESEKLREMEVKVEESTITDYIGPEPAIVHLKPDKPFLNDPPPEVDPLNNLLNDGTKTCNFCGKEFKFQSALTIHEKIHLNLYEYECPVCKKRFNTTKCLYTHNLIKHTDPSKWRFQCELCNKRFPMKSGYTSHVRRHNNVRDFLCHLCEKRFNDKVVLKNHLLTHSKLRQFKCDLCGSEHKLKHSLNLHKVKKHNIGNFKLPVKKKNFTCEICGKAFEANSKLQRHLCTHTGERPFKCHLCNKGFSDVSYLKPHLKKDHNEIDDEDEKE